MTMESEASDVEGSLSLASGEEEFTALQPGTRACLTVWGNVETNANGEQTFAIDKAAVMPGGEYPDEEALEEEAEPVENPAVVAIRKDTVKAPSRPPVSVVDVMVGRPKA